MCCHHQCSCYYHAFNPLLILQAHDSTPNNLSLAKHEQFKHDLLSRRNNNKVQQFYFEQMLKKLHRYHSQ